MVSPFGRGFDSLQLHTQKKDHLTAAFLSYVEHVTFFYIANAKALHFISLGGHPAALARGLARPNTFKSDPSWFFCFFFIGTESVLNNTTCRTKTAFLSGYLFISLLRKTDYNDNFSEYKGKDEHVVYSKFIVKMQ